MQKPENTTSNATPHPMQQHGKGLEIVGDDLEKIKVIIGDEERLIDPFKIVATWINPKPNKSKTYAYPSSMIVNTLLKKGIKPRSLIEAVRIEAKRLHEKCSELIIYDNRPFMMVDNRKVKNPYQILAWWQDGRWLPVEHPEAKKLAAPKPKTYAS